MNRCMFAFLFAASALGIQAQALDPTWVWEAKLPPFAKTKPVVRTNTLWRSQQWQIWIGFTCFLEDTGLLFTGIRPTIAGTTESWDGEINCKYVGEYIGQSGQTIWFPMGVGTGICAGHVPIAGSRVFG